VEEEVGIGGKGKGEEWEGRKNTRKSGK